MLARGASGFRAFLKNKFGSQCCKCTLKEPHAPKMHVHTPSTASAFSGQNIEDLLTPHPVPPCDGLTYGICPQSYLTVRTGIKMLLTNNIRYVTKLLMPKRIN